MYKEMSEYQLLFVFAVVAILAVPMVLGVLVTYLCFELGKLWSSLKDIVKHT